MQALEFLEDNGCFDHAGCQEHLQLEPGAYWELKSRFEAEFEEVERIYFSKLEHIASLIALGKVDPKSPQASMVKWMLERGTSKWRSKSQLTHKTEKPKESNGKGRLLINEFMEKRKRERSTSKGTTGVPNSTIQ